MTTTDLLQVRDLLRELRERGVEIRPDPPDRILFRGPVDDALRERIREAKPALLAYLTERPTWPCSRCGNFAFAEPDTTCYWCRKAEGRPGHA